MLVLTLKEEEGIRFSCGGQEVVVFLGDILGSRAKVMVQAPKDVRITRMTESERHAVCERRDDTLPGRQFAKAKT